jgi:AraC family transcriptional regulator
MAGSAVSACGCPRAGATGRQAGDFAVRRSAYVPACELGSHAHAEDRVVLTLDGAFHSHYTLRHFAVDEVQAIYRPAFVEHADRYERPAFCLSVLLPREDRRRTTPFALRDGELPLMSRRLSAELDADDGAASIAIESLCALIASRLGAAHACDGTRARWLRRVRDRIEDEYANPPSLTAIAADVGRDPSHVAATFRAAYGTTIGDAVRTIRVWRARTLLEDATIPWADVALRAGFADQSHFARLFKRRFSMTPMQYRRRSARAG